MIAILEFEAPKSCKDCKLHFENIYGHYCVGQDGVEVWNSICDNVRHPGCPLKFVEDEPICSGGKKVCLTCKYSHRKFNGYFYYFCEITRKRIKEEELNTCKEWEGIDETSNNA